MHRLFRRETAGWLAQLKPYAFMTVTLNRSSLSQHQSRLLLTQDISQLMLRADQSFLGTRHVTRKQSAQRFHGVGFFEKMAGYPHCHIVLFIPPGGIRKEKLPRLHFLARHMHTNYLSDGPLNFAFANNADQKECIQQSILRRVSRNLECDVRPVYDYFGLAGYVTKCYNKSEDMFLLSEFFSDQTRSIACA